MLRVKSYVNFLLLLLFTQACLTLCSPMDCRTLGFPVLHYLLELAQTHVYGVSDAIQPSCPLSSPSPPSFYLYKIMLKIFIQKFKNVKHLFNDLGTYYDYRAFFPSFIFFFERNCINESSSIKPFLNSGNKCQLVI